MYARFEVLRAVFHSIQFFWVVMLCHWVSGLWCNYVIFLVKMEELKAFQTPLTINLDITTHCRRPESSNIIQFIKLRNSFAICQEILSISMRPTELQWMGNMHSHLLSKTQSLHGALTAAVLDTIFFIVQL